MTEEIVQSGEETAEAMAVRAHENKEAILAHKNRVMGGFLELGRLFSECHDESLWKLLNYDSFEEFLADPDLAFKRSYAYQLMSLYKMYVLKLNVGRSRLEAIGPHRLIKLLPFMSDGQTQLLADAEHLSLSDLNEEIAELRGEAGHPLSSKHRRNDPVPINQAPALPALSLDDFKMARGCCVCGEKTAEKSHFPRTRGAGAGDDEWLPMCHNCHSEAHQYGVDTFLEKYKIPIFKWVYGVFRELREQGKEKCAT
jgi:hypothetical protein